MPFDQYFNNNDNILYLYPVNLVIYKFFNNYLINYYSLYTFKMYILHKVKLNQNRISGSNKWHCLCFRQDKDVYLLDDPLAAVDAHVAKHLYNKCIMGLLKNKTRILCTHHTNFLSKADLILVMEDGKIAKAGIYFTVFFHLSFLVWNFIFLFVCKKIIPIL